MQKIEHTTIIEAPIHEVFEYASNWKFWKDWFYGFTDCSPLTGVERGNGTIYDYKMRVLGFNFKLQTEIHNFVENKGWNGIGIKGVPHKTTWIFEDLENRTKFTYVAEYSLPIPILGSIICTLFTNPEWRRILKKSLDNFAAHFQH
jgi:uncharacterized protein YndB with AHSA1/START domain